MPNWLSSEISGPLFVSRIRLKRYRHDYSLPDACWPWALDAGGFSELSSCGHYQTTPELYAEEASKYLKLIGRLRFATIQDWMCEPEVRKKTGLSVLEHQKRTIESYWALRTLAPEVNWLPILQGWELCEYHRHIEMWRDTGVELQAVPLVGVGSICRRQESDETIGLIRSLYSLGLKLHCFGVKITTLKAIHAFIESADSMAWSFAGRRQPNIAHTHKAKQCANCLEYAVEWKEEAMRLINGVGFSI